MSVSDTVLRLTEFYETKVKPSIREGDYVIASMEMLNLLTLMYSDLETMLKVHFGPSWLGAAQILQKKLDKAEDLSGAIWYFEMYSKQAKLFIE